MQNQCLFQSFEWHSPGGGQHYRRLTEALDSYKALGITNIWLPPSCKAANAEGNGYDIYDLWDLGEFPQKKSIATKWGTKSDLLELVAKAKELGIGLIFDAVISHKTGADRSETCVAVEVSEKDRTQDIGRPHQIEAWLAWDFPGRGDKYSSQKYHREHFNATDYDAKEHRNGIFKTREWAPDVDDEKGNYDYLIFSNLDYSSKEVREDVKSWGVWVTNELSLSGFRIDAIKHISRGFVNELFEHLNRTFGSDRLLYVGEYWTKSVPVLCSFLDQIEHKISLFDPLLLENFSTLSLHKAPDMRNVLRGTLVEARPDCAVTIVTSHDTQPGQTLDSPIVPWFLPLAYAIILLRKEGMPCVFSGDLHGIQGSQPHGPACAGKLPLLMFVRKLFAYGLQKDYLDSPNCIGWTRQGTWDRPDGLAVVMSAALASHKKMLVGRIHAGEVWKDVLGHVARETRIDRAGFGLFRSPTRGVSVFVKKDMNWMGDLPKLSVSPCL